MKLYEVLKGAFTNYKVSSIDICLYLTLWANLCKPNEYEQNDLRFFKLHPHVITASVILLASIISPFQPSYWQCKFALVFKTVLSPEWILL